MKETKHKIVVTNRSHRILKLAAGAAGISLAELLSRLTSEIDGDRTGALGAITEANVFACRWDSYKNAGAEAGD